MTVQELACEGRQLTCWELTAETRTGRLRNWRSLLKRENVFCLLPLWICAYRQQRTAASDVKRFISNSPYKSLGARECRRVLSVLARFAAATVNVITGCSCPFEAPHIDRCFLVCRSTFEWWPVARQPSVVRRNESVAVVPIYMHCSADADENGLWNGNGFQTRLVGGSVNRTAVWTYDLLTLVELTVDLWKSVYNNGFLPTDVPRSKADPVKWSRWSSARFRWDWLFLDCATGNARELRLHCIDVTDCWLSHLTSFTRVCRIVQVISKWSCYIQCSIQRAVRRGL